MNVAGWYEFVSVCSFSLEKMLDKYFPNHWRLQILGLSRWTSPLNSFNAFSAYFSHWCKSENEPIEDDCHWTPLQVNIVQFLPGSLMSPSFMATSPLFLLRPQHCWLSIPYKICNLLAFSSFWFHIYPSILIISISLYLYLPYLSTINGHFL